MPGGHEPWRRASEYSFRLGSGDLVDDRFVDHFARGVNFFHSRPDVDILVRDPLCLSLPPLERVYSSELPSALKGISQVDFVSGSVGLTVASGRLLKTIDGGDSGGQQL